MGTPRVSIIIPSWDGYREGCVPRLLRSVEDQAYRDYEVVVVEGVSPQGRAINEGVQRSIGEYIVILDDDSRPANERTLGALVECLDSDPRIGLAGASLVLDPESSDFQRRASRQFPRLCTPTVDEITESDLACHGCCALRRTVFDEVGGEREDILRGLDPDLRTRLRRAGYRVVLTPQAHIHHPLPGTWRALIRLFFRNGYGSAYAQKYQPDSVYDTHEELHEATFVARRSLVYRALRFPVRLARAAARGEDIRLVAYSVYATGYVWGWVRARRIETATRDEKETCTPENGSKAA